MSTRPSIIGSSVLSNLEKKISGQTVSADAGTVTEKSTPSKGESNMVKTTAYFSRAVHEKLREIAFTERKSINDLMMEGLDAVLTSRTYPTTKDLTAQAKASQ